MKVGEVWISKEDGDEVRILELNMGSFDEVLYEHLSGLKGVNYLLRHEFVEHYKKKY